MRFDEEHGKLIFTTKDMITKQLKRDGPKIRRSFDKIAGRHITACSEVFGEAAGLIIRHLPRFEDSDYSATASRLLNSAANTYLASIEVARHGYRRQYGMLARSFIETIATVIAIAIKPTALQEFHENRLKSTKCVGWAKEVIEPIGLYYGMLSENFVHIGPPHAAFEGLSLYTDKDEAISFIGMSMRGNVWMLYLATELIFFDELAEPRYWKPAGGGTIYSPSEGVAYLPSEAEKAWMTNFLQTPEDVL